MARRERPGTVTACAGAAIAVKGADRESAAVIAALVIVALTVAAAVTGAMGMKPGATASVSDRSGGSAPVAAPSAVPPTPLAPLLAEHGYLLPAGVSVYAAEVNGAPQTPIHRVEYAAGDGVYGDTFWPASSIKVLAALGALDFLHSLGFTGAASITSGDGWTQTVKDLAAAALEDSSNEAYDMLVQVAGFDRLNASFLSPANGFPSTVIERSYSGIDIRSSPAMTITEGGRTREVPARTSTVDYQCPDQGNCSNLFEMTESVERVVLDPELPAKERLNVDPQDIKALTDDLQATETFIEPGVKKALGQDAIVYGKPGWVSGKDCVDIGAIQDVGSGRYYVLGVTSPDAGPGCDVLSDVAEHVLTSIEADQPKD